ncbi:MAG: hypothetical protein ACH34U_04590 [Cyanobium sp.]
MNTNGGHPPGVLQPPGLPARKDVLAASSPWLGAGFNILPGLGTGYIYQRRWRAYWFTVLLGSLWLALQAEGPWELGPPLPELLGLALFTAAEAFLAARRARMD